MKLLRSIFCAVLLSLPLLSCWQEPGAQLGVALSDLGVGSNSIVGINYYTSRLTINSDGLIHIDWAPGGDEIESDWTFATSQSTYSNIYDTGLPITLYFNIYSAIVKNKLLEVQGSSYYINSSEQLSEIDSFFGLNHAYPDSTGKYGYYHVDADKEDTVKSAYLYYKILRDVTLDAQGGIIVDDTIQNSSVWHLCGEVHLDETKTNVFLPGNKGALLFGRDTLTKKKITNDGETISSGDYIVFFLYVITGDGTTNVDEDYRPQIKKASPILPSGNFASSGAGYQIGHIYVVKYDGTEVYWK